MNLPENKKPKKIIYDFGDEQYYISGEALQDYHANVSSASVLFGMHGGRFKKIKWKKVKSNEKKIDDTNIVEAYNNRIHAIRKKDDKFIVSDGARGKIQARLKEFTEAELLEAIDNFANEEWWMSNNSHRGVAWFFHSMDRIEQFINLKEKVKEDPAISKLRHAVEKNNGGKQT